MFLLLDTEAALKCFSLMTFCPCSRAWHCTKSCRLVELMHWQTHRGHMAYAFEALHPSCDMGSMILS